MKFKLILITLCIIFFGTSSAEKLNFNIDHKVINSAKFDDGFGAQNDRNFIQNDRDFIELYQDNNLITKIPSFDEDGGNRFEKILTRYDGNNIIRVITYFPDRGHFRIYYDIGFNKNKNLFMLNKVSFEIQEWLSETDARTIYCYHQINQEVNELMNSDDWFHKIRPSADGWEDGTVKGNCIVSNKIVEYENAYIVVKKSHLLSKPDINHRTKMYLVKGDIVNLLKQDHDFYYVEYINSKNKATKKWLHCSALEACNKY